MSRFLLALAASAGLISPVYALDTHPAWEGFWTVTANTPACAGIGGSNVGDVHKSIYRPALGPTEKSAMSVLLVRGAFNVTTIDEVANPQMRGNGSSTVRAMNGRGNGFNYSATFSNVATSPTTVSSTTGFVTVTGTFNDAWNVVGCNLSFKASYGKEL